MNDVLNFWTERLTDPDAGSHLWGQRIRAILRLLARLSDQIRPLGNIVLTAWVIVARAMVSSEGCSDSITMM